MVIIGINKNSKSSSASGIAIVLSLLWLQSDGVFPPKNAHNLMKIFSRKIRERSWIISRLPIVDAQ